VFPIHNGQTATIGWLLYGCTLEVGIKLSGDGVMDVKVDAFCVCAANLAIAPRQWPELAIPLPPFDRRGAELSMEWLVAL